MRNTILASIAVLYLFTGAQCGSSSVDVGALVQQVQASAVQACSYVPTAEVIIALYNADTSASFDAIAHTVCSTIGKPGARAASATPTVKGVTLKGYYVSTI